MQSFPKHVRNFIISCTVLYSDFFLVEGNERPLEGSGLRSEFAAFLERSKAGDRKQQDLERIISQLEDDVAKYTDEIMVLEERLTDKLSYISLLEGKLEQKNSKMTHMQNEIKTNLDNKTELEKQVFEKFLISFAIIMGIQYLNFLF